MEYENKYASKGVAGAGLGLGIAGTALGVLAGGLNGTGLFNGNNCSGGCCSEDHYVNRYELDMENKLVAKDSEISLLKSNIYTDQKIADVYERLNGKIGILEGEICKQSVVNAQVTANISCMQGAIATLQSLTKTIVPIDNVCPAPMPQYNSWTAPTTTAGA